MMSEHLAHLTSNMELVHFWLWWSTHLLFDFDSALAQGSDFESEGDILDLNVIFFQ